jgi:hypothetical protein
MKKSTVTTSKSKVTKTVYGVDDWRKVSRSIRGPWVQREADVRGFFDNLWPATEIYTSNLNPVFLLDLPRASGMDSHKSWLVRDGLIPLIWFFTKNPKPAGFSAILRIHSDFEEYVPPDWRAQVQLFEPLVNHPAGFQSASRSNPKKINEIYLMGLVMPSVCSIPHLENDLALILKCVGGRKKLSEIKLKAILPQRYEPHDVFNGASFHSRFVGKLCRELGTDIEFIEFDSFNWMYPETGSWFHEFNSGYLYVDSAFSAIAIGKGLKTLPVLKGTDQKSQRPFDEILPMYPHVSCGIRKSFAKPFVDYLSGSWVSESQEKTKAFQNAISSSAHRAFPWPQWFSSWCTALPRKIQS